MLELYAFVCLGVVSVVLMVATLTRRVPVTAAMCLVASFVCLAALYGLLDAPFAAVAQVIVYAGAIMVLFVFVVMLLNLPEAKISFERLSFFESFIILLACLSAIFFGTKLGRSAFEPIVPVATDFNLPFPESENTANLAALMLSKYLWAFEISSGLIVVAMVGAVAAVKRGRKTI